MLCKKSEENGEVAIINAAIYTKGTMPNKFADEIPKFYEFFNPVIQALRGMDGRASRSEIESKIVELMNLSEEQVGYTYDNNDRSIVLDRTSWALSWLKKGNIVKSGGRSIWILVNKEQEEIDVKEYHKKYSKIVAKETREKRESLEDEDIQRDVLEENMDEVLLDKIKQLDPVAFERLCKRLLEESGVTNVEETSKSHDRGIDGIGVLRVQGLVSLRIAFQAKRYTTATVGSEIIRNFRGSLPNNIDKGIVITTGKFTPTAKKEALDPEKSTIIDLIDGDDMIRKIKEYGVGVKVEEIKSIVEIDDEYFEQFKV